MQRLLNHGASPTCPFFPLALPVSKDECAWIVPGFANSANSKRLKPPLNSHECSQAVGKN
jgi:hypothetical protein